MAPPEQSQKPQTVWVQLYVGQEKRGQSFGVYDFKGNVDQLKEAVKEKWGDSLPCPAPELTVYASGTAVPVPEAGKAYDADEDVPNGTKFKQPLIVVAPQQQHYALQILNEQQQLQQQHVTPVTANAAKTAILKQDSQHIPDEYHQVAADFSNSNSEPVNAILQQIERLADMPDFKNLPQPFVSIVESSGMGKTQLAATTAYMRPDALVAYFYVGQAERDTAQPFYQPHIPLWMQLRPLLTSFSKHVQNDEEIAGAGHMFDCQAEHVIIPSVCTILFPELGFEQTAKTMASLRLLVAEKGASNFFVFLDEVPPDQNHKNVHAMRFRNFLRAAGVCPILMSTHTGSHNALPIRADSRSDGPDLWCRVFCRLPPTSSAFSYDYKTPDERPLVARIVSDLGFNQQNTLEEYVTSVRKYLIKKKQNAWIKSPIFQLCLLFRSTKNGQESRLCSHLLVGEHFGHFDMDQIDITRNDSTLNCRVRMPEAEREPILYLALASWKLADVESKAFPLQACDGQALSVREAFELCKENFKSGVFFANPEAMKNDGDLMEVLSLASMTLASLCADEGILCGVPLPKFIALVFAFMLKDDEKALQWKLTGWPDQVKQFLDHAPHVDMKIPAVPSAASEFPEVLFFGNSNALRGKLKRPPDSEERDGVLVQNNKTALVQVECKNYKSGISTDVLQRIIKRMRVNGKVAFIFTSFLNGVWKSEDKHDRFWNTIGMNDEEGGLCIMRLQAKGDQLTVSWVQTLSGTILEPRRGCEYLLVVFEVEEVVST